VDLNNSEQKANFSLSSLSWVIRGATFAKLVAAGFMDKKEMILTATWTKPKSD
jgi:hypothetical protein